MSNTVTSIAKRKVIGSSARKAVLMYMADNASDDGSGIWTSKANMAADLEMSKRTVQAHIQAMVEMGVIIEVGYRQCKNGFTVEYAINLEALSALKGTRAGDAPVQEMHPHPCSTCTPTRAGDAPKPPLEPPLEPSEPPIVPQDRFDDFWAIYPRKVAKGAARKAWGKAIKKCSPDIIIAGCEKYAKQRNGQESEFTAHASTWLNAERWTDEAEETAADFHNKLEEHLNAELHRANGLPDQRDQSISPRLEAPVAFGRRGENGADQRHSGRDQLSYADFIRPRKFK